MNEKISLERLYYLKPETLNIKAWLLMFFLFIASVNFIGLRAETLTNSSGTTTYAKGAATGSVIDPGVVITGSGTINNAMIYISSGFSSSEDLIIYPTTLYGISGSYSSSTGIMRFSGSGTAAQYQEVLRSVQYRNTNKSTTSVSKTFIFSLGDAIPLNPCDSKVPHFYRYVSSTQNWTGAKNQAATMTYYGLQGYLATITCKGENDLIQQKLDASAFIGASDAASEGVWKWVTGPEAGTLVSNYYSNWNSGEPNNANGGENYACIYGSSRPSWGRLGEWNDVSGANGGNDMVVGYVVEFGGSASDPSISISGTKQLTIYSTAPDKLSYSPNPVIATVNTTSINSVPTVAGTVVSYSINPALPAGVSINQTTGIISGTPSVTSPTTNYTVTATNTGGSTTTSFTLTVNDIPPTLSTSPGTNTLVAGVTTANIIDANLTLTSGYSGSTLDNANVFISSGFVSSEDKLIYPVSLYGVTGAYNSATGVLLLSGTATIAQYQEILRTIMYQNTNATSATTGLKSFTFSLGAAIPFTPCGATVAHYYEFISSPGTSWTDAKIAAESKKYFGLQGYLTTFSCAEENDFAFKSIAKKGWIGASDAATEGDWYWVTGPEAGTLFFKGDYMTGVAVGGLYNNWDPNSEPNNAGGNEDYAHFLISGKWNDLDNNSSIDGYYVEYGGMTGDMDISISGVKNLNITLPAPTANSSQEVCGSGTVGDLVAIAPGGSSVRWYSVATGGVALAASTTLVTGTYYAESWNGVSVSSTRTAVVLTINAIPAKPILVPTSSAKNKIKLCPGDNIVCSNFDNTLSYQWKLNGNNLTGETTNQYKVPADGAGVYSLYVKNSTTGCDISSDDVTVDVYNVTTPIIYEKKKTNCISILIVDNRQNLYSSYLWTYSDGSALPSTIVNDRQFLVLPPSDMDATYMVNITDTNACKAISTVKSVTKKTITAKAYPTLNNGNFMVGVTDAQEGKLNVKIFNQNGILQKVYSFDNVSSEFEYQINATGLKTGTYTVEISLGDYVQTQKVIIQ